MLQCIGSVVVSLLCVFFFKFNYFCEPLLFENKITGVPREVSDQQHSLISLPIGELIV